jgi:creatinine amidohydrolase
MMGRTSVFLSVCNWWTVGHDIYHEIFDKRCDHAGEMETSVVMHSHPQLVNLADAGDGSTHPTRFEAINQGWVSTSRQWNLLTDDTGSGNPHAASAEKGEKYVELVAERLAQYIYELGASPMDEKFPF